MARRTVAEHGPHPADVHVGSRPGRGMTGPAIGDALARGGGGLALAHGIAQRHGARLALHSTPGVGTVATVSFPPAG